MSAQIPDGDISVLVVDDHELIRQGLVGAFGREPGMTVVDEAATVTEALKAYETHGPAVVVTDLQLPDGTGLDIIRAIRRNNQQAGLVVVTMHSGDDQIFAAMEAGASAFVGKDAPSAEVVKAAKHAVVSPRSFLCAGLVGAMMRRASAESTRLSDREHEVLLLLADGLGAGADRPEAVPERVHRQVPHRPDLPEARRQQPRPGAGDGDADRASQQPAVARHQGLASQDGTRCRTLRVVAGQAPISAFSCGARLGQET